MKSGERESADATEIKCSKTSKDQKKNISKSNQKYNYR